MIDQWYDCERWISERLKGNKESARKQIQEYTPLGAVSHYRKEYSSFRVNGLEFARMNKSGRIRDGIERLRLNPKECSPAEVVNALRRMFDLLSANPNDLAATDAWSSAYVQNGLAAFLRHASRHHQAEHWLESKLLLDPSLLGEMADPPIRSQVNVFPGEQRTPRRKHIDLLAINRRTREVWVIELKVTQADGNTVKQASEYARWVHGHLAEFLDASSGYFGSVEAPSAYRVAVALVAPRITSNLPAYIKQGLSCFHVRVLQLNSDWRRAVKLLQVMDFPADRPAPDRKSVV
jgi:hypothetical protein